MLRLEATNWTVRGELLVGFFVAGPIASEVWRGWCDAIASGEIKRALLASVGALEIDAAQRRELAEALQRHAHVSLAVVTDEAIVRGLVTATTWLGRIDVRTFAWHRLVDAVRHLAPRGVSERDVLALVETVRRRAEQ